MAKKNPKPSRKTAEDKKTAPAPKAVKAARKTAAGKAAPAPKNPVKRPAGKPVSKKSAVSAPRPSRKAMTQLDKMIAARREPPRRGPVAISTAKPRLPKPSAAKKLSKSELKVLRDSLVRARERLVNVVKGLQSESLVRHDEVNHEEDGTDAFIRLSGLDRAASEQDRISMIDDALRSIDADSYGICETCGKRIEYRRLLALPFARTCIHCQAAAEKTNDGHLGARQQLWDQDEAEPADNDNE